MKNEENFNINELFGLTKNQSLIMYSIQSLMILKDIVSTKSSKHKEWKAKWLSDWQKSILSVLSPDMTSLYNSEQIRAEIEKEVANNPNNKTWYYIVMLECTFFSPYTPLLEDNTETRNLLEKGKLVFNKIYEKSTIKFSKQTDYLKELVAAHGIMESSTIDRYIRTHKSALSKTSNKKMRTLTTIFGAFAVAATVALAVTMNAGSIAVLLVGEKFAGLHGIALVNACLAYLGGGAIAVGGAGMAGGTALLAGGGALLGLAAGGSAMGMVSLLAHSPEYALSQAAKLEVVLTEIVLNVQKDVYKAQQVLENYKESIKNINSQLAELEMDNNKKANEIKNLKKSLEYFYRSYSNCNKFTSCFEIGLDSEVADEQNN